MANRHRAWCFTLNNYTDEDINKIKLELADASYAVIGKEVGEEGTPHLQGYFQWKSLLSFNQVKSKLGDRAHLEPANGTPGENKTYCSKAGDYFEIGSCKRQGQRTDLEDIRKKVKEGETFTKLIEDGYNLQALKYAEKVLPYISPVQRDKPMVYWFHGPSGSGKTRTAVEMAAGTTTWISPAGTLKWFDGYDGQETAILDDYRSADNTFNEMLRLLDRYPCRVQIKGGMREWRPKLIIITTRFDPHNSFPKLSEHDDIEQLLRRIDKVRNFSLEPYVAPVAVPAAVPVPVWCVIVISSGGNTRAPLEIVCGQTWRSQPRNF